MTVGREDGETLRKVTRYPTGWFVTSSVRMYGPFETRQDALAAAELAGYEVSR